MAGVILWAATHRESVERSIPRRSQTSLLPIRSAGAVLVMAAIMRTCTISCQQPMRLARHGFGNEVEVAHHHVLLGLFGGDSCPVRVEHGQLGADCGTFVS